MKTRIAYYAIFLGIILIAQEGFAQSAKKYFKAGNEYNQMGNYEMAIDQYSKAIELDQKYSKAIEARAQSYEQLAEHLKAAEDYESLTELSPKEFMNGIKAASLFIRVGNYNRAMSVIASVEQYAPEMSEIYAIKAKCLFAIEDYQAALEVSNKAVRISPTAENYYVRGLIKAEMNSYNSAELDFKESAKLKPTFTEAIVQQALMLNKQNRPDEALLLLSDAIEKGHKSKKAFLLRSSIYLQKSDYKMAIEDLTNAIAMFPDADVFFLRAEAYFSQKQYNEAINDYSKAIQLEKNNINALEKRGNCYQILGKNKEAEKDYNLLISIVEKTESNKELIGRVKKNLLELGKENNKPKIVLLNDNSGETDSPEVAEGHDLFKIKIKIINQSAIAKLSINKTPFTVDNDIIANGQYFEIDINNKSNIEIYAEDIYQNKSTSIFKLSRVDKGLPQIELSAPITYGTGLIYLNSFEPEVLIEGKITGKNYIDSIHINNIPVNFNKAEKNPAFRQKIRISDLNDITFMIKDEKGNQVRKKYEIDRSDAELFIENPMGRTWVVFIENSDYSSFTNLEGPKKEVDLMIKALSKYKIDKIIHKKNLTRLQMNSFFTSELKNLVNENRVNSLLIWYAGHGKLLNQNGFWIPVDTKLDDVSSYYNINTLKNTIKPYLQNVTHSLIVTDACETGPSFYMSMRGLEAERNCGDKKSTKSKSSQVFTSSTEDFSDNDSQFSTSFANALMFDSNSCVPIERIVNKVSLEITKSSKKKPVFGRITGLEDENGTFMFIKK